MSVTIQPPNVAVDANNATSHREEERDRDSSNLIGRSSGSQRICDHLYRSRQGRYNIVHKRADTRHPEYAECVSPEDATHWSLQNEYEPMEELRATGERISE
jgi:hypothetical protein